MLKIFFINFSKFTNFSKNFWQKSAVVENFRKFAKICKIAQAGPGSNFWAKYEKSRCKYLRNFFIFSKFSFFRKSEKSDKIHLVCFQKLLLTTILNINFRVCFIRYIIQNIFYIFTFFRKFTNFCKFLQILQKIRKIFVRNFQKFPEIFEKNLGNFRPKSTELSVNLEKNTNFWKICQISRKFGDTNFRKFLSQLL